MKAGVVVLVVVESSSDDFSLEAVPVPNQPPMRSIPAGLCQDTWSDRPSFRVWDCSHSPLKVRQLVLVSVIPPHAVSDDCV